MIAVATPTGPIWATNSSEPMAEFSEQQDQFEAEYREHHAANHPVEISDEYELQDGETHSCHFEGCGKIAKTAHGLAAHIRAHLRKATHECPICHIQAKTGWMLARHIATHARLDQLVSVLGEAMGREMDEYLSTHIPAPPASLSLVDLFSP